MHQSRSASEKFVDAVYRRLVICRTIEQLGLGLLLAALLAIGLNLLAIWQAMPTTPIFIISTALGLLFGSALAIYRRPTRAAAAIEADRQLGFDDLLTSAIFSTAVNTDDFLHIVKSMADARCRLHSPNDVLLRRLDLRAWSGIGVAVGVAVTLAVIPFGAQRSQAIDVNAAVLAENPVDAAQSKSASQFNNPADDAAWGQQNSMVESKLAEGTGKGLTTSNNENDRPIENTPATGKPNKNGIAATGGMASVNAGHAGDQVISGSSASNKNSHSISPWQGGSTVAGPSSFLPPTDFTSTEDRDLIRDFFDGR